MAYREKVTIVRADEIATDIYEMCFSTKNIAKEAKPGQFVSVYSNDGSRFFRAQSVSAALRAIPCALYTGQSEKAHRNLQQCTQDRPLKYRTAWQRL